MEAKLQEAINKLLCIQKAHIYEPKIEDVAEISFKAGMKEVTEWIREHTVLECYGSLGDAYDLDEKEWQDKLKEWGVE